MLFFSWSLSVQSRQPEEIQALKKKEEITRKQIDYEVNAKELADLGYLLDADGMATGLEMVHFNGPDLYSKVQKQPVPDVNDDKKVEKAPQKRPDGDTGGAEDHGGDYHVNNYRGNNYRGGKNRGNCYHGGNYRGNDYRGGNYHGANYHGANYRGSNYHGGHDGSNHHGGKVQKRAKPLNDKRLLRKLKYTQLARRDTKIVNNYM